MTTQGPATDDQNARQIDEVLRRQVAPTGPGAAVIAARDGRVLFRGGYGLANLELGVPIESHMIFRLGSITKQFTAVAILMLAEEGKLALDDPLTRFLPSYPASGNAITIRHLLTHTSGIKSYTELPEWLPLWRKDLTLAELVDLFAHQPAAFAPGEKFAYSNSGYVLLGAIIERAAGQSYEAFLQERIFGPLGMEHSGYDHTERVLPGRVAGYQKGQAGWENAPYLSMTHPHGAGALYSSVDDLARWDEALYSERLLRRETLEQAFTPAALNNGTPVDYGFGWRVSSFNGHRVIEHGGGIHGFLTDAKRLPDDHLYVAVLMNSTATEPPPGYLALQIVALLLGQPYEGPTAAPVEADLLASYEGVYRGDDADDATDDAKEWTITRKEDHLVQRLPSGRQQDLYPCSPTEFFPRYSFDRFRVRQEGGGATVIERHTSDGKIKRATKTNATVRLARQPITLDPALYDRYAGVYELAPGLTATVRRAGDHLFGVIGREELELLPASPTVFFFSRGDAEVEFTLAPDGVVTGLVSRQGGQTLAARKLS